jgi:undecaprenyl diphosphate synthase
MKTVDAAVAAGVRWLTAFTFSTENWGRSDQEVEFLMWFKEDLLLRRRAELFEKGVALRFLGDRSDPRIPERNRRLMDDSESQRPENVRTELVLAFNHGGRAEIVHTAQRLAEAASHGELDPADIDEARFARSLDQPEVPDLDLVIRTSGEHRISNFMLWRAAYAEYVFTPILWPDFDAQAFVDCLVEYQGRVRRFGGA